MRRSIIHIAILAFVIIHARAQAPNSITVRVEEPTTVINKHIYGHFAEHLGKCIYGGFYVGEKNTQIPHVNGVRKDVVEALK